MTTRLLEVMSWLMAQKAVHQGEAHSDGEPFMPLRLSCDDICMKEMELPEKTDPGIVNLYSKSLQLYQRIRRLDANLDQTLARMERKSSGE